MTTHAFRALRAIAKRLTVLLVSVVMLLSITQTAVLAATSATATQPGEAPGITEPVPGENINELKEQRREWQEKASSSRDVKNSKGNSLGGKLQKKLNLDEMTKGLDSQKGTEKRSLPDR